MLIRPDPYRAACKAADAAQRFGVPNRPDDRHRSLGTHNALLVVGRQTGLNIIASVPSSDSRRTNGRDHLACD